MSELDYTREYEGAVTTETRAVQRWNCPDCLECILWQSPMTRAERIYHHYRVGHKEGGSLIAPQPEPDAGMGWRVSTYDESVVLASADARAIARCGSPAIAAQIVTDHARAALVPGLVEALESAMKVVSDRAAGGRMLTTADEASAVFDKCDAALALVKGRE